MHTWLGNLGGRRRITGGGRPRAVGTRGAALAAVLAAVLAGAAGAAEPPSGPLDVDQAVRIALRQNYGYRQSQAGLSAVKGSRLSTAAGLLPSVSGSYTYSKSSNTSSFTATQVDGAAVDNQKLPQNSESNSTTGSFSVSERLGLSNWYQWRGAEASVTASRHGLEATGQELAFQVRQQFYLVLRAQDLLTVQQEALRLAQDELKRTQSMFDLGSVAKVDVLKAQVAVSQAELTLIQQRNQVEIENSRLATMLGLDPSRRLDLSGDLSVQTAPMDSSRAAADALVRPDVLQAEASLGSASNRYKAAFYSRVPSLFASFDYNKSTGSSIRDSFQSTQDSSNLVPYNVHGDLEAHGWSFRVGATVTLDAFLNTGDSQQARANKRQAEYELEAARLAAQQELEEALLNYRASVQAIQTAQRGLDSVREDLRLSEERYSQGLGTVLELLEAQVNLTRARNDLVNAQTGLKISEAAVDRARGADLPR